MSTTRQICLGDVAQVFNGKTPSKSEQRAEGHPVLKIKDVSELGQFRGRFDSFVDASFAEKFSSKKVRAGDILILNAAHNADYVGSKTYRAEPAAQGALATGEWLVVRPSSALSPDYAYHWITSQGARSRIRELVKGIHLYPKDVARLNLPYPTITEQVRIASILNKASGLRSKRRQALANLDTLAQSIFVQMFGDPAQSNAISQYQRLGEHLTFLTSGGRGWAEYYTESGSRFVRSFDVQMNRIGTDDKVFVTPPQNAEAKRTRVSSGDVLLTITGSLIGRVASAPTELEGAYISQHVAILRLNKELLEPEFISYFLSLDTGGQRQIAKAQYGQTKPGLNFDQIRAFSVPVPNMARQREFLARIRRIGELRQAGLSALQEADFLFASLQHRAFCGEL